ncbi:hypothetical protein [Aurantimonas coralicida]|uniref:hypothetical protein n=1 Tax=Aurantimonas coralicida TaxID=182270 RepID=UPI001E46EBFF|nr:hypothetical protein [Aurantimonas coralicida]MCD1644939.1 hypothetical protein [Aurantimonas coralicida]
MSVTRYQARADAAKIRAANAKTEAHRHRHEESRKNWQRLADEARKSECESAPRLTSSKDK